MPGKISWRLVSPLCNPNMPFKAITGVFFSMPSMVKYSHNPCKIIVIWIVLGCKHVLLISDTSIKCKQKTIVKDIYF